MGVGAAAFLVPAIEGRLHGCPVLFGGKLALADADFGEGADHVGRQDKAIAPHHPEKIGTAVAAKLFESRGDIRVKTDEVAVGPACDIIAKAALLLFNLD